MELSVETTEIEITTFINPHLFWIVINNEHRKKLLSSLSIQMMESIDRLTKNFIQETTFEIGEIVAAKINKKYYRATIEDIFENTSSHFYLLWLIDFGTMTESTFVYKLPTSIRKTPSLSFQASINNIVYIEQALEIDPTGMIKTVKKHVINPYPRCREDSMKLFSNGRNFKFKLEKTEEGIAFGDILFKNEDNTTHSLRDCLAAAGIVDIDEAAVEGLSDFIVTYKESHLMAISKICNKNPYPLEGIESKIVNASCTSIVSKILDEFQYNDIVSFEDAASEPLWRFRRSKNRTLTSLDNTLTDSESPKSKSKKGKLMEKLWQYKDTSKTNESTDDTASETATPPKESKSKIKRLVEQMKERKSQDNTEVVEPKTPRAPRKINLCPAGAERTFIQSKSTQISDRSSDESSKKRLANYHSSPRVARNKKLSPIKQQKTFKDLTPCNKDDDTSSSKEEVSDIRKTSEEETKYSSTDDSSPVHTNCANTNVGPANTLKIKQHCICKHCTVWSKEENVHVEDLGSHAKVARIDSVKAQLLFREDQTETQKVEICAIDYQNMRKIEKQSRQKVLVHSEMILNPIQEVSKVAFHTSILRNLDHLSYREATKIQSYAWPAILRNQHVFMINGPQTGKTIAYLPIMLTFILEKHDRYDSLLKVAGGPIVIILCSGTQKCEEVYDLAKVLMRNIKANISLVTYPQVTRVNTSHTDMLITTPKILGELLRNKNVNFKRLCHLIFEDGDIILTKHKDMISSILELAQSMLKNRVFTKALQLIVCAEHWNSQIKQLMKSLQQIPTVCIGNYLEASLYGQIEFSMKFMNSACKEQELKHILKDTHRIYRSVILCKEDEIEDLQEILTIKGIDNLAVNNSMTQEEILFIEDTWSRAMGGTFSVLICSDFVLHTILSITCANIVIHYSLPQSWTKFVKRFCCLVENCKSPLDTKESRIISKSIVLCDESCQNQMFKFFNYINSTDLKKQLPGQLQAFSEGLKRTEEEQKLEKVSLCDRLKLYGNCCKNQCPQRHIINPNKDISSYLPKSGKVKFKIIEVLDVVIYSIQLLQYVDANNKIHEFEENIDVTEDLTATLRLSKKKIHNLIIGHRYAFYNCDEIEGNFYRCELLKVDEDCVQIKLLDKGYIVNTMISRLYRLPKEFDCDVKPRAIIDAYLANFIPPYDDENFSAKSFFNLKTLLESHNYKNVIFTGEVHLQLDQTLWLKYVYEEVVLSDKIIPGFQLSREILVKTLVEKNPNQLFSLYKLCIDAGVVLPQYEKKTTAVAVKQQEVVKQWAFLDLDNINEVYFSCAFSPDEFYVRLKKFDDLLYTFQNEIQQTIRKPNYPKLVNVKVGDVCLAKYPESVDYCRVLILRTESDKALCFSVDFADEAVIPIEDLRYIQDSLITKLPFQAIRCRFHGILPVGETWDDNVTNTLYNYAHEPGTEVFRSLFVKVCKKEPSDWIPPKQYAVLVKDSFSEKKCLVNQLLIECGMVRAHPEEPISDFEIPVAELDSPEVDEELEQVAYICKKVDEIDEQVYATGNATQPIEEDVTQFDLFILADVNDFFNEFLRRTFTSSDIRFDEPPVITAAPQVDYYTPDVYWCQTDKLIKLSIRLTDAEDYRLNLTKTRILNFRATRNEKTYRLNLMLYGNVINLQHTSLGPEVRVILTKTNFIDWPRLIMSQKKARNIHYDVSKLSVEDDENKKILQMPNELNDESDGSNDEGPMYSMFSDLDSDMDREVADDSSS